MSSSPSTDLVHLLQQISGCTLCSHALPFPPRPVLRVHQDARLLIIGQAPGTKVQQSGIPWDDASGRRLREWLQMSPDVFYDQRRIAIVPMGFCYPGRGRSGDLPPRKECARTWHGALMQCMPDIRLILLTGQYAQNYYLPDSFRRSFPTLTERVRNWQQAPAPFFPLPHPSPRNQFWLKRNPWFEKDVIPALRKKLAQL